MTIDWCLMPPLAVFQQYRDVAINLIFFIILIIIKGMASSIDVVLNFFFKVLSIHGMKIVYTGIK